MTKHTRRNHATVLKSTQSRNAASTGPIAIASNSTPNFIGAFYDHRSGVGLGTAHNFHGHLDNTHWSNNQIGIFMDAQNQQRYGVPYTNVPRSRSADARMGYDTMDNVHFGGNTSSFNGSVHGSFATVAEDDLLSQNSGSFETTQSSRSQPMSPMDSNNPSYPMYIGTGENGHHHGVHHGNNNSLPPNYYYPNLHPLHTFENPAVGPPPPLPYFQRDKQGPVSPTNHNLGMLNDHTNGQLGNAPFANNLSVHPAYHEAQQQSHQQQNAQAQQLANQSSHEHSAPITYESNLSSLASPSSIHTNATPVSSFYATNNPTSFTHHEALSMAP